MPTKEELENDYINNNMSFISMGIKYNVSNVTIKNWFIKLEIKVRSRADSQILAMSKLKKEIDLTHYLNGGTITETAKLNKVSTTTIHKKIKEQGLHQDRNHAEVCKESKKHLKKNIDTNNAIEMYNNNYSILDICKKNNISNITMMKKFKEIGFSNFRTRSEDQKLSVIKGSKTKLEKYGYAHYPETKESFGEIDFRNTMNLIGFNFISNRHILNNGKELDGFDEEKMIAFEYCGEYWHSEKGGKSKDYHYNKWLECKNKGIKLYTIFESEWKNNREKIINFIYMNNGLAKNKIFARKTNFIKISKIDAMKICNENHIQGYNKQTHSAYGLEYDKEIINIMTFGNHHRDNTKLVMNRFCGKYDWQIIGGASKIIKNASNIFKQDIITWSDNRWSLGNVYEKMGCIKIGELKQDYYWTDFYNIFSKQSRKKSATKQPKELTEKEYNESLGLSRIWDCGKIRWMYEYKEKGAI